MLLWLQLFAILCFYLLSCINHLEAVLVLLILADVINLSFLLPCFPTLVSSLTGYSTAHQILQAYRQHLLMETHSTLTFKKIDTNHIYIQVLWWGHNDLGPSPFQLSCSRNAAPEQRNKCYFAAASYNYPLITECSAHPIGMSTLGLESWTGFSLTYFKISILPFSFQRAPQGS